MKELGTTMNGNEATPKNLRIVKEQWLDKLHYKKVKLEKDIEKRNRKKQNMFQRDQKGFFPDSGSIGKVKVKCPRYRDLLSFGEALGETANLVSEFAITDENIKKESTKRKIWRALGIDGIQNF